MLLALARQDLGKGPGPVPDRPGKDTPITLLHGAQRPASAVEYQQVGR